MRHVKKLSLTQAGHLVGITASATAHFEQGRTQRSRAKNESFLGAYRFTRDEYLAFFDGDSLPISLRDECIGIVKQLDEAKVQAVHVVLVNFMPREGLEANRTSRSDGHKTIS